MGRTRIDIYQRRQSDQQVCERVVSITNQQGLKSCPQGSNVSYLLQWLTLERHEVPSADEDVGEGILADCWQE